jgi:hypothetical protein
MREHFSSRQGTSSLGMLEKDKKTPVVPSRIGDMGGRNQSKRRNPNA